MLLSVIIPTYNRRAMIVEALRSVVAQSVAADEIIVVDDGSSDDTDAALAAAAGPHVLIRTQNRGVAAARNLGVARARGDLIAFLDSDDLWLPHKISIQKAFFRDHPEASICQTEELWIRNGVRVNPRDCHRKPSGDIFFRSLERCLVSPSAVMMRRSLFEKVGGFDATLPACEDYDLWLRIAQDTPVWLLPTPLVVKRGGHADQLSRQHWGMDRFRVASLVRLLADGSLQPAQKSAAGRVVRDKCFVLANGASKRGHADDSENYLRLARWAESQFVDMHAAVRGTNAGLAA